jgi:hypothetical protein
MRWLAGCPRGAGADRFLTRLNANIHQMGDDELDGYARVAGAPMAMRNGAPP